MIQDAQPTPLLAPIHKLHQQLYPHIGPGTHPLDGRRVRIIWHGLRAFHTSAVAPRATDRNITNMVDLVIAGGVS
jgi:hypothetical protein